MAHHGTARAVIGAGYGDEGKGLLVDALAAAADRPTVIRFNGGAQAGHTVTTPDGRRHVFHHVGAGTFAGADTHLSRFFVSNPLLLGPELAALTAFGVHPQLSADPNGLLSTPYDMMINQFVEEARGPARHGSCGVGFGETIERSLHHGFRTTVRDLGNPRALRDTLDRIRSDWVPRRLTQLGRSSAWLARRDLIGSEALLADFMDSAAAFAEQVRVLGDGSLGQGRDLLFEGAQGLMLDQDRGAFPHVTRSHTGIRNVLALCERMGIARLDVIYATRCYVTRHGAGPLAHALAERPSERIVDATNVANAWQGTLRFGELDVDILGRAIRDDLADARGSGIAVRHALAVTCLDQALPDWTWHAAGERRSGSPEATASAAARASGAARLLQAWGPTRSTLHLQAGTRQATRGAASPRMAGRRARGLPSDGPGSVAPLSGTVAST